MATPRKADVAKDRTLGREVTLRDDLLVDVTALLRRLDTIPWPSPRWRDDPRGFAEDVLRVDFLGMEHQVEILEAIRDNPKVAVASGNKAGKTGSACLAAVWFYSSFPDARVVMTASTAHQVDAVLWRQIKLFKQNAAHPIDGEMGKLARTGLKAPDLREIVGFTAAEAEAVSGVSGANILYIIDEASSLRRDIYEAIEGNTAGGARIFMISNPTRSEGVFFEAFHQKKDFWWTKVINTEDVAARLSALGRTIPGIANQETIDRWKREYGEDSVYYRIRVKGEFILNEAGKAITLGAILDAQARWNETPDDEGPLTIGVDPAGPAHGGDDTAFAVVRGRKLLALFVYTGIDEEAIAAHIRSFVRTYRRGDEIPRVIIDSEGPIGSSLYYKVKGISNTLKETRPGDSFEVFGVKASSPASREPQIYDRTRDELFANLGRWLKDGAIPSDAKLEVELHTPDWKQLVSGRLKLTPKDEIREALGRSPDRADALALAVWNPVPAEIPRQEPPRRPTADEVYASYTTPIGDYYDSLSPFTPR